jgi:hypothetical protein
MELLHIWRLQFRERRKAQGAKPMPSIGWKATIKNLPKKQLITERCGGFAGELDSDQSRDVAKGERTKRLGRAPLPSGIYW